MCPQIPTVPTHFATRATLALLAIGVGCTKEGGSSTDSGIGGDPAGSDRPLQYAPIVQLETVSIGGHPVKFYVPPDPVGLVWGFHGSNGGMAYISEIETVVLTNELILSGFAFAGTQSTDRGNDAKWDETTDLSTNPDIQRLFQIRDYLIETTELEVGTPEFAFGFSNGGAMTGSFATVCLSEGIDVRATAPHLSNGNPMGLDIPIIWSIGANDPMAFAEPEHEARLARGLRSELNVIPELAIGPDYFTRNPGIDMGRSQKTYEEMVRLEGIDEAGNRLVAVEDVEAWFRNFEKEANISSPSLRTEEIRVAWALHRMNGYYAREVTQFFLDSL